MPVTVIKAKQPSDDPIVQVAERLEGKIRDAFIAAIAVLKDKINLEDLAEAMATGTTDTVIGMLNIDDALANAMKGAGLEAGEASVRGAIQQTFAAGAKAAILQLPKQIQVDLSFNLMNPESVKFLEAYEFNLIQQVTQDMVAAIRQVIARAFQEGGHPYEQAREIRTMIGLTARQEQAVENYRTALESGNYSQALDRALRDGRYDRGLLNAIAQNKPLVQERIDAMVDRYSARYVKYRAETIARTESLRAANKGQRALWGQAKEQGLLPAEVLRRWIAIGDDRTCPICDDLDGSEVGMDEEFDGGILEPPAHPDCRCSLGLSFPKAA
jgi:SPP1 gp7 family putative phage head morphogenesis protein